MFWIIAFIALGYCLYQFFILRFIETWGNFGAPEWVMLAVAVLMVPTMVFCAFRAVKSYRATKAKQEEEMKKYREETALRKQRMYMEEDDEKPAPVQSQEDDDDDWEPGDDLDLDETDDDLDLDDLDVEESADDDVSE